MFCGGISPKILDFLSPHTLADSQPYLTIMANQDEPGAHVMTNHEPPRIAVAAISPEDFRRAVNIGKTHYHKLLKEGRIKVKRTGRKVLIPVSEVAAFLARLDG